MAAFVLAGCWLSADAAVLSPEEALDRALASSPQRLPAKNSERFSLAYRLADEVYVFATDGGFVAVPGDDMAPAVLGYSDGDSFDADNMPPALEWWLKEYGRQIEAARANGVVKSLRSDRAAIEPMVKTLWNQDSPYNDLCPIINGDRSVTGCLATAMAQVMKYHNYPPVGRGTNRYKVGNTTVKLDFSTVNFDWDNMLDSYTSSSTEAQKTAVAQLMFACGVSVNMNYSPEASGASDYVVSEAMVKYFDYDEGVHFCGRDYYGLAEWEGLVYSQLVDCGPVLYCGQSNQGGHAFVCDGYSSDGYFHINWGWGGVSDGYFLLTALDPAQQGIGGSASGFNYGQSVIADMVKPREGSHMYVNLLMDTPMSIDEDSADLGSYFTILGNIYNFSTGNVSGHFGAALRSASSGETIFLDGSELEGLQPLEGVGGYYVELPEDLAEGNYLLTPVFCPEGGDWQAVPVRISSPHEAIVTVSDGKAFFTLVSGASIKAENLELLSPLYFDSVFSMSAELTNDSESEYYGVLVPALLNENGTIEALADNVAVDIMPGTTEHFEYLGSFSKYISGLTEPGHYTLALLETSTYEPIGEGIEVDIKAAQTPVVTAKGFSLNGNHNNADRHKLEFTATVSCTEGYFAGDATVYIFPNVAGAYSEAAFVSPVLFLEAGKSSQVNIKGDFANGKPGETYSAGLYVNDNFVGDFITFRLAPDNTGVEAIDAGTPEVKLVDGTLVLTGGPAKVTVFAPDGRTVLNAGVVEGSLPLTDLQRGVYIISADFGLPEQNIINRVIRL